MNRLFIARLPFVIVCCVVCQVVVLAKDPTKDDTKSDEIKIKLKDFKFILPDSVSNASDMFVFDEDGGRLCFYTNGEARAKFKLATDGDFDVVLSLSGDSAQNIHPKFELKIDDKNVGKETSLRSDDVKDYRIPISVKAGEHTLSVAFTNDIYKEGEYDSNLYLYAARIAAHKKANAKDSTE